MSMTLDTFIAELEIGIEGLTPGSLAPDSVLRELVVWDSLAALATLVCVDACFGVQITALEIRGCRTVRDVYDLASSKQK